MEYKDLTLEQKYAIYRFHTKEATMDDVAESLNLPNKKAYAIYTENIQTILNEFREKDMVETKMKAKEPPKPPELNAELKPELEEPESEFKFDISDELKSALLDDELPIVIQGEYANEVAEYLLKEDGGKPVMLTNPENLGAVNIVDNKAILLDIEDSYILVRPVFDSNTNTLKITVRRSVNG